MTLLRTCALASIPVTFAVPSGAQTSNPLGSGLPLNMVAA
jgi:hypothetical protein